MALLFITRQNYTTMLRIYNSEEWLGKFNTHKEYRNIKKINVTGNPHVKFEQRKLAMK